MYSFSDSISLHLPSCLHALVSINHKLNKQKINSRPPYMNAAFLFVIHNAVAGLQVCTIQRTHYRTASPRKCYLLCRISVQNICGFQRSMPTELTDSSKLIGGRIKIQHLLRCLVIAFQHKYCMLVHVAMRISWSSCLHGYWVTVWSDHDSVNVNNASTCIWHSHCYSLIKLKANAGWMLMQRCCFCLNI